MSVHICPPDHAHADTATCYTSHACRCTPCREASTEYSYWRHHMIAAGRVDLLDIIVDATGARRRLQALQALGHSGVVLARHLGADKSMVPRWSLAETMRQSTVDRIAELYEQLSATKPNPTTPAERRIVAEALIRDGRPDDHICRVTGYSDRQVLRIRNKITRQAAA